MWKFFSHQYLSVGSYFVFSLIRTAIVKKAFAYLLHLSVGDHLLKWIMTPFFFFCYNVNVNILKCVSMLPFKSWHMMFVCRGTGFDSLLVYLWHGLEGFLWTLFSREYLFFFNWLGVTGYLNAVVAGISFFLQAEWRVSHCCTSKQLPKLKGNSVSSTP